MMCQPRSPVASSKTSSGRIDLRKIHGQFSVICVKKEENERANNIDVNKQ